MNEINYKSLIEQSPFLQLILDTDFKIVAASKMFLDITGTSLDDITGKDIFTIYNAEDQHTPDAKRLKASLNAVLENKIKETIIIEKIDLRQHNNESRAVEKNYWQLTNAPIFDEANVVKYIFQVAEEVLDREKETEHLVHYKKKLVEIEASKMRYYELLMDSPFAFCVLMGDDFIVTLANDLMKAFWGKGADVEGKRVFDVLPEVVDQGFPKILIEVLKNGETFQLNEVLVKLNKHGVLEDSYFNVIYQPYFEADKSITGVTCIAYEVTEMVITKKTIQANELFSRSILESSPDCIKIIDEEGRIEFMNEKGICLLEMDDFAEAKNKYWWDLWEEQDKPMIKDAVSKAFAKEKVHFQASGNTIKGNNKWWDVIVLPLQVNEATKKIEKLLTVSRDITDYKIANLKVVESEHNYRRMIYSSPFLIAILKGKDCIVEIANDAIIEVWAKGKDVIGKSMLDILPELVDQGFKEILNKVYTTGESFKANEMPINIQRNGVLELRYFSFVYDAQKNLDGVIEGISIIANEVTPQAIINQSIKTSEEQFRLLVQQAPAAICVLMSKDYIVETVNQPMAQLWKRTIAEVKDKPIFDVLIEAREQGFRALLDNVYDTGIPFTAEELPMNLLKNGVLENIFVRFVYEPLRGADGNINGVMALAIEITEQVLARKKIEESEKHFRQLADMMPSKISNADTNGNVIYFNKNWLDYTGKSFEELKDLGYHNIMHPDELEEFSTKFLFANETMTPLTMEMRFLNKNGEYKWHLNNASPIINDGKITMWVGSTTEIHEQITQKELLKNAVHDRTIELEIANKELVYQNSEKEKRATELGLANYELAFQMEEKDKRSKELGIANIELAYQNLEKEKKEIELISLNKELHSFTYVASHDLQEPLRKIKLFSNRITELEHQHLSDIGKDYFIRIQRSVDRMQQLIEDLLSFSRTGTAERTFINTDLNTVVEEAKEELKETIEENNALIEIGPMCHTNVIVFQFRQLMHNLISNAIKFSKPGIPPHVKITSQLIKGNEIRNEFIDINKTYCHISVKDNGIGFDPEYSKRIFEVFQRLHGKEQYKGTGIGLAIVKKIVENHNGVIAATSNLGEGATFDIYLPSTNK